MVCDLVALDSCVQKEILDRFDHTNLNTHAAFNHRAHNGKFQYRSAPPAHSGIPAQAEIISVRVEETANNSFEYPA